MDNSLLYAAVVTLCQDGWLMKAKDCQAYRMILWEPRMKFLKLFGHKMFTHILNNSTLIQFDNIEKCTSS